MNFKSCLLAFALLLPCVVSLQSCAQASKERLDINEEAEARWLEKLQHEKYMRPDTASYFGVVARVARFYWNSHQNELAEVYLQQAIEGAAEIFESTGRGVAKIHDEVVPVLWEQERYSEAEPLLIQRLRSIEQKNNRSYSPLAEAVSDLAQNYTQLEKYQNAEPLFLRARDVIAAEIDRKSEKVESKFERDEATRKLLDTLDEFVNRQCLRLQQSINTRYLKMRAKRLASQ